MPQKKDITGQIFGHLKAIRCTGEKDRGSYIWEYECLLCGKRIKARIGQVSSGYITSCGCFKQKNLSAKPAKEKLGQYYGTNISRLRSDGIQINNTSGHKGVSLQKKSNKWVAYIYFKGKRYYLGIFDKKEDAIKAREIAEKKIHGEFLEWYNEQKKSPG